MVTGFSFNFLFYLFIDFCSVCVCVCVCVCVRMSVPSGSNCQWCDVSCAAMFQNLQSNLKQLIQVLQEAENKPAGKTKVVPNTAGYMDASVE